MQRRFVKPTLFVLSSALLAGCQALPGPTSDLRITNPPKPSEEAASQTDPLPQIQDPASRLSIGLFPLIEQPVLPDTTVQSAADSTVIAETVEAGQTNQPQVEVSEQSAVIENSPRTEQWTDPNGTVYFTVIPQRQQSDASSTPTENTELPATGSDTSPEGTETDIAQNQPASAIPPLLAAPASRSLSQELNWEPSLVDPHNLIGSQLNNSQNLEEKIQTIMTLAYVVDAQLYINFRDLLDRLPEPGRAREMERQRVWLEERKEALTSAFLEFEDEKAARYNAAQAFLRESNKRIAEIQEQLTAIN